MEFDNYKDFVAYYLPQIGSEVVDSYFNAPLTSKSKDNGLTATKLFNAVLDVFFFDKLVKAIRNNDYEILVDSLNKLIEVGISDLKAGVSQKWLKSKALPYSLGNKKVGKDTLVFNTSPAQICPSACKGLCNQCKTCYAFFSERRHIVETVRNLIAFRNLLIFDIEDIIMDTLLLLSSEKELKSMIFIRINSNGDLLDNKMLSDVNLLVGAVKSKFPQFMVGYTYTHNKLLDFSLNTDLVINFSFKAPQGAKQTITAYKWDNKYLDNSKYVICTGNCSGCSYCKDETETRIIVFMAHGGGLKGLDMLPDGLIDLLEHHKKLDYPIFEHRLKNYSLDFKAYAVE